MKLDETRRVYSLIGILGITLMFFLMLVSIAGASPFAYITNTDDGTVSVIDTATNKVTATVKVGYLPYGVAVSSDGKKVYVTDDGGVSVIDTTTNTVTATVPVGSKPTGIAVNPNGNKVYVTNYGDGTVSVIDTATNTVTDIITVGNGPFGVAVNPAGTKVYVANFLSNTVSVIDTTKNKVTATVNIGYGSYGIAVTPDGKKVYVTMSYAVLVIDAATNTATDTVPVEGGAEGVAVNPAGTKVYVANNYDGPVSVIDIATNKVTATVAVGEGPAGVAVTPNGKKVYVANHYDNTVSVIDTATNTVTTTVPVGDGPIAFGQFIFPISLAPFADFSAKPTEGKVPLKVAFTDTSTGSPTSWKWDFGDGSKSFLQNPINKYPKAGIYTVNLTVKNAIGRNTVTKTEYIKVVTKPVANFTSIVTSGKTPLNVAFTDASTGIPTGWKWDFGDGSKSFLQNPTHKYSKAGIYTVNLTVKNAAGSNTVTKTDDITVVAKPVAEFSAKPAEGKAPLTVAFNDTSTGSPIKWKWSFGDGTTSTQQNPTHKYSKVGRYTVTLTATNANGSNMVTKTNYIKVVTKPIASFSAKPTSGLSPLTVAFTDTSTGIPTKWKWSFGDGVSSTKQNPRHEYSKAGNYTVSLTVKNAVGSNSTTKSNYITVVTKPVAEFSAKPTEGKAPLTVIFSDESIGNPTSWKWDFGDGDISTIQNPIHNYSKVGRYTVILTATNADGSSMVTKTDYIKVVTKPVANFTSSVTSGKAPFNVAFTDTSTGIPTGWKWDFGDGKITTIHNPIHKYSKAGNYTVKFTASNVEGSNTVTKKDYIIVAVAKPVAEFSAKPTEGKAPLTVAFNDTSTGSPIKWKWSFGDGTTSTQQNPTHKYSKVGRYTVTLTAINGNGSSTLTKTDYINVATKPVANFTSSVTFGKAPLTLAFTDTSTGIPTGWKWNFGDGSSATVQNPMHMYSKAGNYTVKLTASNVAGNNMVRKTDYIKVTT